MKTIHNITKIDIWFLNQIQELVDLEKNISKYNIDNVTKELIFEAKKKGYADRQIAYLIGCLESQVHEKRIDYGINRVFKLVDTCAAEFEAKTPYYYSTFEENLDTNGDFKSDNDACSSKV